MTAYNAKHPYEPDWQIPLGVWANDTTCLVIAGIIDAVESVKATMLGKYKMMNLRKIHLILGCELLYDEVTGDYSMIQRHYVIDLCK